MASRSSPLGEARGQCQVVRAARVARGLHAQLACRVAAEEIALHPPALHHLARLHAHAFVIKRRAALAAQDKRVFQNIDVLGKHHLAQRVEQKAALAVQRAPTDGLHKTAQQPGGQGDSNSTGHSVVAILRLPRRLSALGGIAAHGLGRGQFVGRVAHGAVPGIALHARPLPGQSAMGDTDRLWRELA
jgi:hypothetical protein